jgi:large subunit ribosomal protein L31
MKDNIHPQYFQATVYCGGCGSTFTTGATMPEIRVAICSQCHPFYTGKQKLIDTEGRVDRFKKKYGKPGAAVATEAAAPADTNAPQS